MTTPRGPGYPPPAAGPQWTGATAHEVPGYRSRVLNSPTPQRSRTRLWIAVAAIAAAVVAIGAVLFLLLGDGETGPSASTRTFLDAVKAKDGAKAAAVSCQQAATLAEHFGQSVSQQGSTLGEWQGATVEAPEMEDDQRSVVPFDLAFTTASVHGRSTLLLEDGTWKVCALDFDAPRVETGK